MSDTRILPQQVIRLGTRVDGTAGVQEGAGQPGSEAVVRVRAGGHRPVAGGSAEDGMDPQGGRWVVDLPEVAGGPVIEGAQPEVDHGAAPQRLGTRKQFRA